LQIIAALLGLLFWGAPGWAQDGLPRLPLTYGAAFDAIGRLGSDPKFQTSQGCTAALIAPDLLLTAAHCLSAGPNNAVFAPGWRVGRRNPSIAIARTLRHPDYGGIGALPFENDIALAVLSVPVAGVTPLELADMSEPAIYDAPVALLGYHVGAQGGLSGAFDCPVGPGRGRLMGVECPVRGGNSGSPLLIESNGEWRIVGVAVARAGDGAAMAVALDDWLRASVAAHLEGR